MENIYIGLRTTSNKLHLGHFVQLLDTYYYIRKNIQKINNFYILLAQLHSIINTNLTLEKIDTYTENIKNEIIYIFNSFDRHFTDNKKIINKIKFIEQLKYSKYLNELTYCALCKIKTSYLLNNPIYKTNSNKTVGLLIYPILQAFDVLLFGDRNIQTKVCVSNDQKANLNIISDIKKKFNIDFNIKTHINKNVLYDEKRQNKMSKSLNNTVNINYDKISEYIKKYITHSHLKFEKGIPNKCPLYIDLIDKILTQLELTTLKKEIIDRCSNGNILCKECKNLFNNIFKNLLNNNNILNLNHKNHKIELDKKAAENFVYLKNKILT